MSVLSEYRNQEFGQRLEQLEADAEQFAAQARAMRFEASRLRRLNRVANAIVRNDQEKRGRTQIIGQYEADEKRFIKGFLVNVGSLSVDVSGDDGDEQLYQAVRALGLNQSGSVEGYIVQSQNNNNWRIISAYYFVSSVDNVAEGFSFFDAFRLSSSASEGEG